MRSIFGLALASAMLFAAEASAVVGVPQPRQQVLDLIVAFHDASATQAPPALDELERFTPLDRIPGNWATLRFRTPAAMQRAVDALNADPNVARVEVAELATAAFVPSDPIYPDQWHLATIRAAEAWDTETGDSNILIAVVDSVAECTTHPDLAPNCRQDLARDYSGQATICQHGYHVSGIAAAALDNGVAGAGIAQVGIVPLRFLGGSCSGSTAAALEAWNYVLELAAAGNRIVVNNSWGGGGYSQAHQDALTAMEAAGVISVAAAGNGGQDKIGDNLCFTPVYPASYEFMFGVAATEESDDLTPFSNRGACEQGAEVAAPGRDILSTCSGATNCLMSGTSMASPMVAGQAALILSAEPDLAPAEVRARIMDAAAVAVPDVVAGRIDLPNALGEPEPGIRVGLSCPDLDVNQAETLTCSVPVTGRGGFSGEVDLACSGVPAAMCSLTPDPADTGETATLRLTPSLSTPPGTYALLVEGEASIGEAHATAQVTVDPEGTVTVTYQQPHRVPLLLGQGQTTLSTIPVLAGYDIQRVTLRYWVKAFPALFTTVSLRAPDGTSIALPRPGPTAPPAMVIEAALDGFMPPGAWTIAVFRSDRNRGGPSNSNVIEPWSIVVKGVPAS